MSVAQCERMAKAMSCAFPDASKLTLISSVLIDLYAALRSCFVMQATQDQVVSAAALDASRRGIDQS